MPQDYSKELLKIEKLTRNSVMMYKKYADAAANGPEKDREDIAFYEGEVEAASQIYDYVKSLLISLGLLPDDESAQRTEIRM